MLPKSQGLEWVTLFNKYQQSYFTIVDKMQRIILHLQLSETDISNLNRAKPIWIEELNSWFYMLKIEQFSGDKNSVRCELIRLTEIIQEDGYLMTENFEILSTEDETFLLY